MKKLTIILSFLFILSLNLTSVFAYGKSDEHYTEPAIYNVASDSDYYCVTKTNDTYYYYWYNLSECGVDNAVMLLAYERSGDYSYRHQWFVVDTNGDIYGLNDFSMSVYSAARGYTSSTGWSDDDLTDLTFSSSSATNVNVYPSYKSIVTTNIPTFTSYSQLEAFVNSNFTDKSNVLNIDTAYFPNEVMEFNRPIIESVDYDGNSLTLLIPSEYTHTIPTIGYTLPLPLEVSFNLKYHNIDGVSNVCQGNYGWLEGEEIVDSSGKVFGTKPYVTYSIINDKFYYKVVFDKSEFSKTLAYGQSILYDNLHLTISYSAESPNIAHWTLFDFDFNNNEFTHSDIGGNGSVADTPTNNNGGNIENNWVDDTKDYTEDVNSLPGILTNGFGLFGKNGFFDLLGNFFYFIPREIITVISTGIGAVFVIILYKIFRG